MKYQSLDVMVEQETRTLQPSEEEDASLTIEEFPGAADKGMRLEARIKYADGVFSPWVSSREPVSHESRTLNNLALEIFTSYMHTNCIILSLK